MAAICQNHHPWYSYSQPAITIVLVSVHVLQVPLTLLHPKRLTYMDHVNELPGPLIYLFIYLLAVLGLRCGARAISSCSEQGLLFVVVRGLLISVASFAVEHRL